jgi:hypothetical protein
VKEEIYNKIWINEGQKTGGIRLKRLFLSLVNAFGDTNYFLNRTSFIET